MYMYTDTFSIYNTKSGYKSYILRLESVRIKNINWLQSVHTQVTICTYISPQPLVPQGFQTPKA